MIVHVMIRFDKIAQAMTLVMSCMDSWDMIAHVVTYVLIAHAITSYVMIVHAMTFVKSWLSMAWL